MSGAVSTCQPPGADQGREGVATEYVKKKINKQTFQLTEFRDQKGQLSGPATMAQLNRKKKDCSFFLVRTQPMKSHGLLTY